MKVFYLLLYFLISHIIIPCPKTKWHEFILLIFKNLFFLYAHPDPLFLLKFFYKYYVSIPVLSFWIYPFTAPPDNPSTICLEKKQYKIKIGTSVITTAANETFMYFKNSVEYL